MLNHNKIQLYYAGNEVLKDTVLPTQRKLFYKKLRNCRWFDDDDILIAIKYYAVVYSRIFIYIYPLSNFDTEKPHEQYATCYTMGTLPSVGRTVCISILFYAKCMFISKSWYTARLGSTMAMNITYSFEYCLYRLQLSHPIPPKTITRAYR